MSKLSAETNYFYKACAHTEDSRAVECLLCMDKKGNPGTYNAYTTAGIYDASKTKNHLGTGSCTRSGFEHFVKGMVLHHKFKDPSQNAEELVAELLKAKYTKSSSDEDSNEEDETRTNEAGYLKCCCGVRLRKINDKEMCRVLKGHYLKCNAVHVWASNLVNLDTNMILTSPAGIPEFVNGKYRLKGPAVLYIHMRLTEAITFAKRFMEILLAYIGSVCESKGTMDSSFLSRMGDHKKYGMIDDNYRAYPIWEGPKEEIRRLEGLFIVLGYNKCNLKNGLSESAKLVGITKDQIKEDVCKLITGLRALYDRLEFAESIAGKLTQNRETVIESIRQEADDYEKLQRAMTAISLMDFDQEENDLQNAKPKHEDDIQEKIDFKYDGYAQLSKRPRH